MRIVIIVIFTFFFTIVYGQPDSSTVLLDRAKTLFKTEGSLNQEELDKFDYYPIVSMLEKVIELNPQDTEARYFLGYAYSRINSKDGRSLVNMDLELLYKSSEQFEKIIELTPKYTGEIIALDPYSKLTAEWGSMAMSYWHNNVADSATWAFREGKKRGGFSDFILEMSRNILDFCSKNAILISSGDNFSIPLWYLQIVENFRTDVAVVDISLLNAIWYPAFLSNSEIVAFDISNEELNTLEYTEWTDSIVSINNFSWTVKPSYYEEYLLRGDRVFLSLLKENRFQRELYFTVGFIESQRLSLKEYLSPFIIVDKLSISDKTLPSFKDYEKNISQLLSLSRLLNLNSSDEHKMFDYFIRLNLLNKADGYLINNENKKTKELVKLLDIFADGSKFPFYSDDLKRYVDYIRQNM